jgi:outer membrane protein TolC
MLAITTFSAFSQETYSLERCKELALENNSKIKNAKLSVEAAEQQKKEAFTKYFPDISAIGFGTIFSEPLMT